MLAMQACSCDRFLYRLEASTLTQGQVAGRTQLVLSSSGSYSSLAITPGHVVAVGSEVVALARDAQAGDLAATVEDAGDYHRGVGFGIDGLTFVAGVGQDGFGVWQTDGLALPAAFSVIVNRADRFDYFGGPAVSRGIAFDPITRKLLLGNLTGVVVTPYDQGFGMTEVATDWTFPESAEAEAAVIGARAGKAYVAAAYRSTENLFQLDLSFTPPQAIGVASSASIAASTSAAPALATWTRTAPLPSPAASRPSLATGRRRQPTHQDVSPVAEQLNLRCSAPGTGPARNRFGDRGARRRPRRTRTRGSRRYRLRARSRRTKCTQHRSPARPRPGS